MQYYKAKKVHTLERKRHKIHVNDIFIVVLFLRLCKESGSTWDMDVKLPKFAENASNEFETIVSFMNKVRHTRWKAKEHKPWDLNFKVSKDQLLRWNWRILADKHHF